jgi:actin-related protein
MFEAFRAPAVYVSPTGVLALFASGRRTGLAVGGGEGLSYAEPIYEGYALPNAVGRTHIAGHDITVRLRDQLLVRRPRSAPPQRRRPCGTSKRG